MRENVPISTTPSTSSVCVPWKRDMTAIGYLQTQEGVENADDLGRLIDTFGIKWNRLGASWDIAAVHFPIHQLAFPKEKQ